jgi:hypothetical protein
LITGGYLRVLNNPGPANSLDSERFQRPNRLFFEISNNCTTGVLKNCPLVRLGNSISCLFQFMIPYYLGQFNTKLNIVFRNVEIFKIISSKSKHIVKDNSEYLGIFHLLK